MYQAPPEQTAQIQHDEKEKHWWDLDDDRKKELLVRHIDILRIECTPADHSI